MDKMRTTTRRPRVVSIPVHFVKSEQIQSASALKIQKAFRGFLVRKSTKQIKTILREVEEIERRIESVKEIGRIDEKERLRLNETLMSLLLKLDSVRGISNGVRDCRRRVIKKAIALQEKVDSIFTATATAAESEIVPGEDRIAVEEEKVDSTAVSDFEPDPEEVEEEPKTIALVDSTSAASGSVPDQVGIELEEESKTIELPAKDAGDEDWVAVEEERETIGLQGEEADSISNINASEIVLASDSELIEEEPKTIHCLIEDEPGLAGCDGINLQGDVNVNVDVDARKKDEEMSGEKERKRSREHLLERMVEENEKLVGMMKELNEKNEIQLRLLNSLAQRVEMLEKTVVCDKLARMKKKKRHAGSGPNNKF